MFRFQKGQRRQGAVQECKAADSIFAISTEDILVATTEGYIHAAPAISTFSPSVVPQVPATSIFSPTNIILESSIFSPNFKMPEGLKWALGNISSCRAMRWSSESSRCSLCIIHHIIIQIRWCDCFLVVYFGMVLKPQQHVQCLPLLRRRVKVKIEFVVLGFFGLPFCGCSRVFMCHAFRTHVLRLIHCQLVPRSVRIGKVVPVASSPFCDPFCGRRLSTKANNS